jgi:hypothetical protein
MYRVGAKSRARRKRIIRWTLGLSTLAVLLVGGFLIQRVLHPTTSVSQSKAVVTKVKATTTPLKFYDEAGFSIELPSDWKVGERSLAPYNVYRWQGTSKSSNATMLEIYQDTIPVNFVVNHVLAVSPNGDQISAEGDVSDNCANFTKDTSPTPGVYGVRGKWQGTDFLCDLSNIERNVVGTSSPGGINSVTVKGPSGSHKFFFTFTDHSLNSDYTPFYNALLSFRVK